MPPSLTILHATIVLPDRVSAGPLHVAGGRVAASAPAGAPAIDLRDHLVFPGLVNAHDHLQLNNIPKLPAHAPFPNSYAWIAAFQPYFDEPAVAAACRVPADLRHWQGGLKNLLAGVTTVAHHDPWHPSLDDPAFPVRLLRRFGWSHSLGLGIENAKSKMQKDNASFSMLHFALPQYGPPIRGSFLDTPPDRPWLIHLAEGTDAIAAAELPRLDALGCLAANTVLIHGVGLSASDVERAIARGAAVVWCPSSNLAMLGRTLDPRRLFDAGRLALGGDSRISGARDLLEELRVAAAHSDLRPPELLRLATSAGARVLGMPRVGGLAAGDQADMLIVRDTGGDPYRALLALDRGEIRVVVRAGAPALADRDLAGWFDACGVDAAPVLLDGRPKLLARALLGPPGAAECEPGLIV